MLKEVSPLQGNGKSKMKVAILVLSVLLAVSLLLLAGTAAETGYCYKSGGNKSFFHCMKMFFVYGAGAGSRRQRASPVKRVPKRGLKSEAGFSMRRLRSGSGAL